MRISDGSSDVCSSDLLRARCDPNAVFAFIKTAGLDQRGTTDTFDRRDRHWPQREALSHPVGLVSDDVTAAKVRIAIAQMLPRLKRHPVGHSLTGHHLIRCEGYGRYALPTPRALHGRVSIPTHSFGQHDARPLCSSPPPRTRPHPH